MFFVVNIYQAKSLDKSIELLQNMCVLDSEVVATMMEELVYQRKHNFILFDHMVIGSKDVTIFYVFIIV